MDYVVAGIGVVGLILLVYLGYIPVSYTHLLTVPLSKRSGVKSGCSNWPDTLPVPPSRMVESSIPPPKIIIPVPVMPYNPL